MWHKTSMFNHSEASANTQWHCETTVWWAVRPLKGRKQTNKKTTPWESTEKKHYFHTNSEHLCFNKIRLKFWSMTNICFKQVQSVGVNCVKKNNPIQFICFSPLSALTWMAGTSSSSWTPEKWLHTKHWTSHTAAAEGGANSRHGGVVTN